MNETLIIIVGVALAAGIIAWLLRRTDLSWDTPARPITLTSKPDNTRCDRIIHYLNQIGAEIQQSGRSDTADIQVMLFKLKNRWKIIYRYNNTPMHMPPHPKVLNAATERDNLEVQLMDKGIDLQYPD